MKRRRLWQTLLAVIVCLGLLSGCSFEGFSPSGEVNVGNIPRAKPKKVESISTEAYVYQTLDDETRTVYDQVLDAILQQEKTVKVSTKDTDILDHAYTAVNADYGGLFWVSGYMYTKHSMGDTVTSIDFSPNYTMDKEERDKYQEQIDRKVEEILSGISQEEDDYEKVKYVFETLIEEVDYGKESENNQNIISVFVDGKTVCQGYACATQYLLKLLNVQSAVVTGKANGESHAWNIVRMDGNYYYVDTTWGNSRYLNEENSEKKYVNFNYFGMTTEEISMTHQAEVFFDLPICTATGDNYYVYEGLYFTEWDPEKIGGVFQKAWENKKGKVSVKFSTNELYEKTVSYFIEKEHISDYCDGLTSMYYVENEEQRILSVSF